VADGARQIKEPEPRRGKIIGGAASGLHKPVTVIAVKAAGPQNMRGVFERGEFPVAFEELVVFLSFFALPNARLAVRMIAIVMILVHGANDRGCIDK